MRRFGIIVGMLLALLAVLPGNTLAQSAQPAQVRVLHASPDTPSVDVYVNNERVLTNLAFPAASDYLALPAGRHRVRVVQVGQGIANALIDRTITVAASGHYTITTINPRASLSLLVLNDSKRAPAPTSARVRVVHAAPAASAVDVWVSGSDAPLLTDQYYRSADYVELPAGSYKFEFANAGTSNVLVTSQQLRLEPGWTYTLALTGFGNTQAPGLVVQTLVDRVGS